MLHVCSSIRTFVGLALVLSLSIFHLSAEAAMMPPAPRQQQPVSYQHAVAYVNPPPVKSYREWKQSMVSDAEGRVKSLKETLLKSRGLTLSATEAGLSGSLQKMLDKEELQLSLTQDLSISDYFVGYLTKQKSVNQAIKEVSVRLSAEEVAELMTAYADNFFSSKPPTTFQAPKADIGL